MSNTEFYALKASRPDGSEFSFGQLKDKVVLIVNTATQCGFTGQFSGLEQLHQKYKDQGLVVLGFPCNQFGGQEPLSNEDMTATCQLNHGVTFPLMQKIDVNGSNTHPVYTYLKSQKGSLLGSKIPWNFTKFLVDRSGNVVDRYLPVTTPSKLVGKIEKLLEN